MVNLIKYNVAIKQFVLFLTFSLTLACGSNKRHVSRIEGREIAVTAEKGESAEIEAYIKPYRENIDRDLNTVLAYSPQTLDKANGEWQTAIGNLMADVSLEYANRILEKRERKTIDIALLNFGGIRSIIPKGNVTTRTAFEIMPFENSLVVAELKPAQVLEMIQYIIAEKKPHPLAGLKFMIAKDGTAKNITVNGKAFDPDRNYLVVTSDYLLNGGDNMVFFKKSAVNYDVDYKLRNVLIDYFKEVDTIPVKTDIRISKEP